MALDGICVRFGGIAALSDVTMRVAAGSVCGIIGPNGAGKTTLFDVISGVRSPDEGRVTLDGHDVTAWSPTRRSRQGVRRTFQRVQPFGWLTVADNVLAATEWRGGGGGLAADLLRLPGRTRREAKRRERVAEVLADFGLSDAADVQAASLPIGMARMVELARAVVDRPRVLLLDEPTSGLDERDCSVLASQIRRLTQEYGTAVLLVEHDVRFVMGNCDSIVALHLGRVLASGAPADVRADERVRAAYLGAR